MASRLATPSLMLLPGALTVYLSFNAGGFFPGTPAFVAILLAAILALRALLGDSPLAGFSRPLAVAVGALALYALWTLLSGLWSNAPGRAVVEFDRVLLYLLTLLLLGSVGRTPSRMRWMLRGLSLAIVAVCVCGLLTRVLPNFWPISANIADDRLSYPITYWNALGLLASVGIILCLHLTSGRGEPQAIRVFGAAAVPPLAATLFFTFSRGAIAAGIVGLVAYLALARPRALLSGLIATAPTTAAAVIAAYHADLLATAHPRTSAAVAQGHDVAVVVLICILAAGLVRGFLLALDPRLPLAWIPPRARRPLLASTIAGSIAALVVVSVVFDAPGAIGDQYDRFVGGGGGGRAGDLRTRLTDPANDGRLEQWDVAIKAFKDEPLKGEGAGTYQNQWAHARPVPRNVLDAHSLYVEALGELGIVGLLLLVLVLTVILIRLATRLRGPQRTLYAALFAAALVWTLHAGVDWDWEMPAVTLWLFAVAGAALASSPRERQLTTSTSLGARAAVVIASLALAIAPALVLISQGRLDDSARAFERGNCTEAADKARSSRSLLGWRPEPYEIEGYCDLRQDQPERAARTMAKAVERDPENWEYRYDLALTRAAAGLDPRPAIRAALRLNPLDSAVHDAARRFKTGNPRAWKTQVRPLLKDAAPFYSPNR